MIGEYVIAPTGVISAADRVRIGVGIGIVSSDAFAAGAGSMPDPLGEPDYPWLYWMDHPFYYSTTGAPLQLSTDVEGVRAKFDIRSMRKFKPRESLAFLVQYADSSGTPPMQLLQGNVRCLIAT